MHHNFNGDTETLTLLGRARRRVEKFGVRVLLGAVVIVLVFLPLIPHLEFIEKPAFIVGLMAVFFELQTDTIKAEAQEIQNKSAKIERLLGSVYDTKTLKLVTFTECVADLANLIRDLDPKHLRATLVVNHLALDMSHAWEPVRDGLLHYALFDKTKYELLVLSSDKSAFPNLNKDSAVWVDGVGAQLRRMREDFPRIERKFREEYEKEIITEIRSYRENPTIHGMRIRIAGILDLYYISFCRWSNANSSSYEWGAAKYYRIVGSHPEGTIHEDLSNIFNGHFGHLWELNQQDIEYRTGGW